MTIREQKILEMRWREFAGPIDELSRVNPVVRHVLQMYARGTIITKEEALSQMVVLLCRNWTAESERIFKETFNTRQMVETKGTNVQ